MANPVRDNSVVKAKFKCPGRQSVLIEFFMWIDARQIVVHPVFNWGSGTAMIFFMALLVL
ncbi:hypothetical protein ACIP1U_30720 [Cupriavidus sp. NPDC089707]|uniref:hypothetical protein n=1 Tax=Cupriavidus sp. NPDC089707 TaxID=3363963 RepID=UPI003803DF16